MSKIIEHFKVLSQIPHCSKVADRLFDYLVEFAKSRGYVVEADSAKNIFIAKGKPVLSLQAHYDMVCMGKAPTIEILIENGWMKARNASLGADNGIGIAMMMALMDEGKELEFLMTSDEEVGLIGANALNFNLQSRYMLNLDSENEAEVYIGCAGGADIMASKKDKYAEGKGECYEVAVKGLAGGHSGVDIDKGIPSAIKVLAEYLDEQKVTQLAFLDAGERRNSIAANAVAVVYSEIPLYGSPMVQVKQLDQKPKILKEGAKALAMMNAFKQGVRAHNIELGIPDMSINLAIVKTDEEGGLTVETSARAMSAGGLEKLSKETISFFKSYGFDVTLEDKYPAWKPDANDFTKLVSEEMMKVFGASKLKAIHAGLECGVVAEKYPQIKFASLGPTIRYPHSTREMVNLKSVEQTFKVVLGVMDRTRL